MKSSTIKPAYYYVLSRSNISTNSDNQPPILRVPNGNGHLTGQRFDRRTRRRTEDGSLAGICYHQLYLTCLEPANTYTRINHA